LLPVLPASVAVEGVTATLLAVVVTVEVKFTLP